jgi:hypothetical protein
MTARELRFHVKLFLQCGIPFGVCMGLFALLAGPRFAVLSGLFSGVLFGLLMSCIIGTMHLSSTRDLDPEDRFAVRHETDLVLPVARDEAFTRCRQSLEAFPRCSIEAEDKARGVLEAATRMTMKSWGERIRFSLTPVDDTTTRVHVSSRPSMSLTSVDYGRNHDNVATIQRALTGGAERARPAGGMLLP